MGKDIAIAYSLKKKQKKAERGVHSQSYKKGESEAGEHVRAGKGDKAKFEHESVLEEMREMPGPKLKASGGMVKSGDPEMDYAEGGTVEETPKSAGSAPPQQVAQGPVSKEEADKFKKGANFAEGGEVYSKLEGSDAPYCPHCKRGAMAMSEGGQVANDTDMSADQAPNEFDDLVLRDKLQFKYTGANSGDKKGGPSKDDLVARAMLKKKAKR